MQNFKSPVPDALQTKMQELAQAICDGWGDMVSNNGCVIRPETIGEIEGNERSGWIPFQDGGFTVSGYYQNDEDRSYHFTEKQTDAANEQAKQCLHAFCMDNGHDEESLDWEDEEFREEFYEYEREWYEEALLQYEIYCTGYSEGWRNNGEDGPQVHIRLSVNYADAPYYREKDAEDIKEEIYAVEEFLALENSDIMEAFTI